MDHALAHAAKNGIAAILPAQVAAPLAAQAQDALPAVADLEQNMSMLDMRLLGGGSIIAGLVVVILLLAAMLWRARRDATRQTRAREAERAALRASLDRGEAALDAPGQLHIVWDGEAAAAYGRLAAVPEIPGKADALVAFANWLSRPSAEALDGHLRALREDGTRFVAHLDTAKATPLIVEGRTAAGRLVMTIRAGEAGGPSAVERREEGVTGAEHQSAILRALLEQMTAPAWVRDASGKLEWANAAYARAVGCEDARRAVAEGRELMDSRARAALNTAWPRQNRAFSGEVSGTSNLFEVTAIRLSDGSAGMARDITAPRADETRMRHQLAAQARTLDTVQTAVAIFGPDRQLLFFNKAYAELWKLDPEWLSSGPSDGQILDALREAGRLPEQADYRSWKKKMLAEYTQQERERMWHLPGERALKVTAEPHPGGGATFFYDDLTEKLRLESQRNAMDKERRQTLENLNEGVALFSSDGVLRLYNPAFVRLWKLNASELKNEPHVDQIIAWSRLVLDDPPLWSRFKAAVTAMGEERAWDSMRFERPDGSVIDCAIVPLPGGATLITYIDVTDTARAERALRERNEALEAADRVKNAFIQHVSYVLRAPLTTIIGYADLLARDSSGPRTEKQNEYTQHVLTSSHSLLAIINDILDLATIDAGVMDLRLAPVDIDEVMAATALGVQDRLQEANIRLDMARTEGIGAFVADAKRLKQVLFNLLTNAISHSPPGGTVTLRAEREADNVLLSVEDEGKGIAPEVQETIFKPFESYSEGGGHRGPGLGLSIVRALVELHGGDVRLRSTPGSGTAVTCVFPANPQRRSEGDAGSTSWRNGDAARGTATRAPGGT